MNYIFFLPETVRQYVYGCSSSPQSSFKKKTLKNVKRTKEEKTNKEKTNKEITVN